MIRTMLPKFARSAYKLTSPGPQRVQPFCRNLSKWNRNVPVYMLRRRNFLDDFFDRGSPLSFTWPSKMLDQRMKQMSKMMDERVQPRFFDNFFNRYDVVRGSAREVEVKYNNKDFEVKLDVSSYNPDEVNVKIQGDKLVISAKHEEKPDEYGYVAREFNRQFTVPQDVDVESLESILTSDGILVIRGKVTGAEEIPERTINIQKEQKTDSEKS